MCWFVCIWQVFFGRFHTAGDGCWLLRAMLRRQEQSLLAPLRWGLLSLNNPSSYFLSFNTIALTFNFSKLLVFIPAPHPKGKGICGDTPLPAKRLQPLGTLLPTQ